MFYLVRQQQPQPQFYRPRPAYYPTWTPQAYDAEYIDSPYGVDPEEAFVEAKRREYVEALELQRQRRQLEQEIERENLRHQAQLRAIAQREAQLHHLTASSPYGHPSVLGAAGRCAPAGGRRQSPFYHRALPRRAPVSEDPEQSLLEELLGIPSFQHVASQTQIPTDCRNASRKPCSATTSAPASCERRVRFTPSPAPPAPLAPQAIPRTSAPAVDRKPRHTTEGVAKGKGPEIDFATHLLNTLFSTSFIPEQPQRPTQASSSKVPEKATQPSKATTAPSTSKAASSTVAPKPATSSHDGLAAHDSDSEEAHWSDAPKRAQALSAISALSHTFETLRRTFTFPSGPLDRVPESDLPRLAFNQHNAPIHAYEGALSDLLTKLDSIESHGFKGVREARKGLVRKIEGELESLEKKVAEALAGAASPVLIPIEVEASTSSAAPAAESNVEDQGVERKSETETEAASDEQHVLPLIDIEEAKASVEGYDVEMNHTESEAPSAIPAKGDESSSQQLIQKENESHDAGDLDSATVEEPSELTDSVFIDHPQPLADSNSPVITTNAEEISDHVLPSLEESSSLAKSEPTPASLPEPNADSQVSNTAPIPQDLSTTVATDIDQQNSQPHKLTQDPTTSSKKRSQVTVEDDVDSEDSTSTDRDFELL